MNQLTSLIGASAVGMALLSRWIFQFFTWSTVALITPVILFITSSLFFILLHLRSDHLIFLANQFGATVPSLIMTAGSCYYVLSLIFKYTLFDMCKEMTFLGIDQEQRMTAKAIIDSVGSRLGKSGASCLTQVLLLLFGSLAGNLSLIGGSAGLVMGLSILSTVHLGKSVEKEQVDKKSHV